MSQTSTTTPATQTVTAPSIPKSYREVFAALTGKVVTVVNPESFEEAAVGHKLTTSFYRGKILGVGEDHFRLQTVFKKHGGKTEAEGETVVQYVPFNHVKRVSVMKTESVIHL
jgi:hypothetical protein